MRGGALNEVDGLGRGLEGGANRTGLMGCKVGEGKDFRVTSSFFALSTWVCGGATSRNGKDGGLGLVKKFFCRRGISTV